MLENRYVRAVAFFVLAFGVPVALGVLLSDVDGGVRVGLVMGVLWAGLSQFFEPAGSLAE